MKNKRSIAAIKNSIMCRPRNVSSGKLVSAIIFAAAILAISGMMAACQGNASRQPLVSQSAASATGKPAVTAVAPTSTVTVSKTAVPALSGAVKATWVDVEAQGDTVFLPIDDLTAYTNTHFKIETGGKAYTYMAYELNGTIYVRANVCPPCRSIGFSLDGDTLICDRCGTVFDAVSGSGIKGACVDYPKASSDYSMNDGRLAMNLGALEVAYNDTMKPGLP